MKTSLLAAVALAVSAARAEEPAAHVVLERIVDARGNRVCDVAKAELKAEGVRRSAWVVRGLLRSDLVLTLEAVGEATLGEVGLAGRPLLRLSSPASGGRVTASSPVSTFWYFDVDLPRKTVRCNLSRLVDETDRDLPAAVSEYALLKQGLEGGGAYAPEERPVLTLLALSKRAPNPSPPFRRRVPMPEGGPETDDLIAAVRAAVSR